MFSRRRKEKLTLIITYLYVSADGKVDSNLTLHDIKIDTHQDLLETLKMLDADFKDGRIGKHSLTVKVNGSLDGKHYKDHQLKGLEAFREFVTKHQPQEKHHDSKWAFIVPTFKKHPG